MNEVSWPSSCAFCHPARPILYSFKLARAFADNFPSSNGHILVVPIRHVERIKDLLDQELQKMLQIAHIIIRNQNDKYDGFNIGINDGQAAGQTIKHVHLHLIPRIAGDVADPRGGIRNILPQTARYWENI